ERVDAGVRRIRDVRARRADGVAHAPARADADRDSGGRTRADRGWPDRGDPAWRCRLDSTRQAALARRLTRAGDDPPRGPGEPQRQGRGVDGEGYGGAVPG